MPPSCALVRVGLLVKPQSTLDGSGGGGGDNSDNNCKIGGGVTISGERRWTLDLEFQPEMANLIIRVSDHDGDGSAEDSSDHDEGGSSSGSGKSQQSKYRTLERVDSGIGGSTGNSGTRGTTRNRPSCRKTRSESQLANGRSNNNNNDVNGRDSFVSPSGGGTKASSTSPVYHRSCDYYRKKFLQDSLQQPTELSEWINFSNVHKIAGQKVVEKLTAQQKALEADAESLRKKSTLGSGGGSNFNTGSDPDPRTTKGFVPIRKKPGKLEPLQLKAVKPKN